MALIPATTGLDLTEDKLRVDPGTLQDCLNYEVAYHSGYRRIDGFLRYDGREEMDDLDAYRDLVQEVPGAPAYGLHFFPDRAANRSWLYAVVEAIRVEVDTREIDAALLNVPGQRCEIYVGTDPEGLPNAWILEADASFAGDDRDLMELLAFADTPQGNIRAYTRVDVENGVNMPDPGDQIENPDGDWLATVRGVEVISGTAVENDIVAVLWVEADTQGFVPPGTTLVNQTTTDDVGDLVEMTGYSENGSLAGSTVAVATDLDPSVPKGALIRATDRGWEPIQRTYEAKFKQGTNEPTNVYSAGSQISADETPEALPGTSANSATFDNDGTDVHWDKNGSALRDALEADDGTWAEAEFADDEERTEHIKVINFAPDIDDLDEVTGAEVEIVCERSEGQADVALHEVTSTNGAKRGQGTVVDTKETITVGSPLDLWGASSSEQFKTNLESAGFGWLFRFNVSGSDFPTKVRVYQVRLTVYLREGSLESRVYLRSGGEDMEARVLYVHEDSGKWADNDVEGVITLARIDNPALVAGNAEIRTEPDGGGNLVAKLDGELTPIRLPSRERMIERRSLFQFVNTNFFAAGRLAAVYGVSGADHAFTFNNQYLFRIRTGRTEDEPRHIARHADRLALGFENGDADFSVQTQPDLFDGALGAFTIGFGQRVTGMLPLTGQTLGVWTESSTHAVKGSTQEQVIQQVVVPTSGAIEYTVADMGIPVFCDFRGINTLAASQQYGDFDLGRLSRSIRAWLLPRLQDARDHGEKRPIRAEPVRKKNQYRLYFADGEILTLTWLEDQKPRFTWQRWWLDENKTPLTILSATTGVDEDNQSVSFVTFEDSNYVFRADHGDSFDGQPIEAHITFNPTHVNGPSKNFRLNVGHVHAVTRGEVELSTQIGTNYRIPSGYTAKCTVGEAGAEADRPSFGKFRHKARGRDFALKIASEGGDGVSPHTIQVIEFPDLVERKLER